METTVKERLMQFIKAKRMTVKSFEIACNMCNGYVGSIRKSIGVEKLQEIIRAFPELNRDWLLYGEGEMLNRLGNTTVTQTNYNGNNNYIVGHKNVQGSHHGQQEISKQCAPIVPTHLTKLPNIDVLKEVESAEGGMEISPIVAYDMNISLWYRVPDAAMAPYNEVGDMLALSPYEQGQEKIIPGKIYVVDTKSNGMIVRKLFPVADGYHATAVNSQEYPEFHIEHQDIIRIFRVIMVARM